DVPVESTEGVNMEEDKPTGYLGRFSVGGSPPPSMNGAFVVSRGVLNKPAVMKGGGGGGIGSGSSQAKVPATVNSAPVVTSVTASPAAPLSEADAVKVAEDERRAEVRLKLNHAVLVVVERVRNKETL